MCGIVYTAVVLFPLLLLEGGGGGMFYIDLYFKFNTHKDLIILFLIICQNAAKHLMENQLIYNKICNIQISPHNFDPVRLLSIRLLHSLNRSMWVAIFPQKAMTTT